MQITRRKFLSAIGTGATHGGRTARFAFGEFTGSSPLVSGAGHYAVVSKHATWGIFETMSQAHREAELIRHSGAIPTTAVRCTPDMVKQYQLGKLGNFVEIDGWAITPGEAKTNGFDLLRRAGDRNNARRQLLEHCIAETRVWLEQHEDARKDGFWYVHDGEGEVLAVLMKNFPPITVRNYRAAARAFLML